MVDVAGRIQVHTNSAYASMLVQMLEQEGIHVSWHRPAQARSIDLATMTTDVVIGLVVSGSYDGIKAAVRKFRERTQGRARVDVHVEPEPDPQDPED